jgi:hypothetical protein
LSPEVGLGTIHLGTQPRAPGVLCDFQTACRISEVDGLATACPTLLHGAVAGCSRRGSVALVDLPLAAEQAARCGAAARALREVRSEREGAQTWAASSCKTACV